MSATTPSALDLPMHVTFFASQQADTKREKIHTLRTLATLAKTRDAPSKDKLPWIKLATFGAEPTLKGSLRHDTNMQAVFGVEGDYDDSEITPLAAADLLRRANIAALIYTSPPHHTFDADTGEWKGERWRVLCPLSGPCTPAERDALTARVNGVLGGVLDPASFTASQAYYIGGIAGVKPETILVEGRPLDLAADLDIIAIGRPGGKERAKIELPPGTGPNEIGTAALKAACALFDKMAPGRTRHDTILDATMACVPYVLSGHLEYEEAHDAVQAALETCDGGREETYDREVRDALDGALTKSRTYEAPSDGSEFGPAPPLEGEPGAELAEPKAAKPAFRLTPRPYIWTPAAMIQPRRWVYARPLHPAIRDGHIRTGRRRQVIARPYGSPRYGDLSGHSGEGSRPQAVSGGFFTPCRTAVNGKSIAARWKPALDGDPPVCPRPRPWSFEPRPSEPQSK
jgi:hypothetical protein